MSKGIELELYFAIGKFHRSYQAVLATIKTQEGDVINVTIDHNLEGKSIIELTSTPILKKDNSEDDRRLARNIEEIVEVLKTGIETSNRNEIKLAEILNAVAAKNFAIIYLR